MTETPLSGSSDIERPRRRFLVMLPLVAFVALAGLFMVRLGAGDPSRIPSALIGRPAPVFALAPLPGLETRGPGGLTDADLRQGHVTLVNVFASWCAECHDEHDALMALSRDPALAGVTMAGIVYKDDPENARRYLGQKGNPFARVGTDPSGRTGIDFGVYGVPETFVIKGDGTIAYKLVGGLTDATRPALLEAIRKAAS
ncbi:DsbE family thiol:disulfide interchange protein [Lichenihabitans psoromatis]|uniref:DsbE family thiol:disulfide interchange protein n=1 Tax=Lichenihabitans psoromatis TaxID=2528642 RepID=UPI0010385549|nr:DsbE family thiol:disulfide interchange protein [Lichenihabitans psoromatis]